MIPVKPRFDIMHMPSGKEMLERIEEAGRVCYKSEHKIDNSHPDLASEKTKDFVRMIIKRGHESVLEHCSITVKFVCNRGVSHELIRHRLSSFSQESTRFVNYTNDRFGGEIQVITNPKSWYDDDKYGFMGEELFKEYNTAMEDAERHYFNLIEMGWKPQQARNVLPIGLKTEIVVTANVRQWRTMFKQRTAPAAHPQMRQLMIPLLRWLQRILPVVFEDIIIFKDDKFV